MNENFFLCGIDFGREYISIVYFNKSTNQVEIVDVSGGYGITSLSACIAYVSEYKEWIVGEYALKETSRSAVFFKDIINNTGKDVYYNYGDNLITNFELLKMLVKEIINQIKNVNPNCQFEKITVTCENGFSKKSKNEYLSAFEDNNIDEDLIVFKNNLDCIKRYVNIYENIYILDVGQNETRIYFNGNVEIYNDISTNILYNEVYDVITKYFYSQEHVNDENIKKSLEIFLIEHKNIALKNVKDKNINFYFGFCYPPFKKSISVDEFDNIKYKFAKKISSLVPKNNKVILSGGIFEQSDFRNYILKVLSCRCVNDNFKAISAMGAALFSAEQCGYIDKMELIENKECIDFDIGILTNEFVPIIEKNNYVYNKYYEKVLLLPNENDDFYIDIFKRENKKNAVLTTLKTEGFGKRNFGSVKIKLRMAITDKKSMKFEIEDLGFGAFYQKSEFLQKYERNDIF